MNIVCIISNSPSATNTATVRNYDELRYTCQELSIETKEKKTLSFKSEHSHLLSTVWVLLFSSSFSKCKHFVKANLIYQSSDEKQKNTWFISICFSLACFMVPCLPMKHTPVGVCKTCNSPGFLLKKSSVQHSEVLISFMDHNFTFHLNSTKQVNGASTQTITSDTNRISLVREMFNFSSCIADHSNSLTPEKIQTEDPMDANRPR